MRVAFVLGMLASKSALAVCLNPFGCEPTTLDECRTEASKRPTERGVTVAIQDCQRRFVTEPAERIAKAREDRLVGRWPAALNAMSVTKMSTILGEQPTEVSGKGPCTKFPGKAKVPATCTFYRWQISDGPMRMSDGLIEQRRFLQVEADSSTGELWATLPDARNAAELPWW